MHKKSNTRITRIVGKVLSTSSVQDCSRPIKQAKTFPKKISENRLAYIHTTVMIVIYLTRKEL